MLLFETEVWSVLLPEDWAPEKPGRSGHPFISSADKSKGVYVCCYPLGDATPGDAVYARCVRDVEVMRDMQGYTFVLMNKWRSDKDDSACMGMDYFDRDRGFRLVTHVIASSTWVVGASFQDYECRDYEVSRDYFRAMIRSLKFMDAET